MSVVIDNITYNIEDEDLDEIEYLEILTMEEIVKDNPNFIAFTREEIFNEVYDFFKDSNKADGIADLFFKDKTQNIKNFVFLTSAYKKDYDCMEENIQGYVDDVNRLSKLPYDVGQKEKNKYYFALTYDDNKQIRLKPYMKTTLKLDSNDSVVYYPIYADDDTNIPVVGAYYKTFASSLADKLSHKIAEHLQNSALINYADADGYSDVEKLVKAVKPKMKTILENIDLREYESSDLDYNDLAGLLMRYDMSLDDISIKDYEQLRVHLESILEEKPHEIKYGKYKIKETAVSNSKFEFFNRINADKKQNILQLLDITDKMKEDYIMLIESLQEEKMNINAPPLLYNNINDIARAVSNNDVALEDVIENLRANRNVLIINHAINTLKGLKENDVESIGGMLDHLTEKFELLKGAIKPGFKFQFLDFYEDIKEVKEANDYSQYDGVPDVYKNNGNYDGAGDGMGDGAGDAMNFDDDQMMAAIGELNANHLEKYWLSVKFANASGFTEVLQTVLHLIESVRKDAKLPLNFERLCDELFKHFSGIPSKYDMMQGILGKADIKLADDFVRDLTKISPVIAMNNTQSSALMSADLVGYVQSCNKQYCDILYDMLAVAMSWWCLQIQDEIIHQTLAFDENSLQIRYYDLWSLNGLPLKESKQGVLVYLSAILGDVFEETGYQFLTKDGSLLNKLVKTVANEYQDVVSVLREQSKNLENKRMVKGKETYEALVDTFKRKDKNSLLNNYIDALVYYPSYKYKQLHKFLLGCCLQQIGSNFEPYNDMVDRKDLQAGKKQLSKKQLNKRYQLYLPVKQVEEGDSESDDEAPAFELPEMPDQVSTSDDVIVHFLEEMIEVENSLLPEDHINNFMKSTKPALAFSKQYVQLFCKTAGYKPNELLVYIENNDVNFKGILLMLCTVYYKYETNDSIERQILLKAVATIKDVLKHWKSLVKFANEYNTADVKNLQMFVISRAICLPCNPDISKGILQLSVKTNNAFLSNLTKNVYVSLMKYMRMYMMPDSETNQKFINGIREQNKLKQLNLMNTKTMDQRGIIMAIKKIGLKYDQDDAEANYDDKYNINNDYKNEFEMDDNEFVLGNEEEYGDDERDEYGFIYS
jgi:hypothetical protein